MRVLPLGTDAVVVDDPPGGPTAWAGGLDDDRVIDLVPAARTVMVRVADPADLAAVVAGFDAVEPAWSDGDGGEVVIPVRYDGEDLADIAASTGLEIGEVVSLHVQAIYRVEFCGFAPGFGYLSGLPSQLHLPRRSTPRTRVPAGAVAIADRYSAVYPRSSPGGWHVLGVTDEILFDPSRRPPAILRPGVRVRFVPC